MDDDVTFRLRGRVDMRRIFPSLWESSIVEWIIPGDVPQFSFLHQELVIKHPLENEMMDTM